MPNVAPQLHEITKGEVGIISVDCKGFLDSGELLTGTPTITEVSTSHFTLSNKAVSTSELTINGQTVAIGEAVQFKADATGSSVVFGLYKFNISCATDAGQTRKGQVHVMVV